MLCQYVDIANDFEYAQSDIGNDFVRVTLPVADLRRAPGEMPSLAPLSRGLVHLFRQRAGRGPTQAKAFWAGDDALLILLGGGYTRAERTLWDNGRPDPVVAYRHAVLEALEDEMRDVVEASVDRSVEAVLVSAHHDPDVMAAVFLLEPLGGSGSAEAGRWGAGDEPASHPPQ
jgi:Na+-translocating membrane potential-generating system (MpsC)